MKNSDSDDLITRLQQIPEIAPPADLIYTIMKRVEQPKIGFFATVFGFFLTPRSISFRPVTLALGASLILVFSYIGTLSYQKGAKLGTESSTADILSLAMQDDEASFLIGRGLMVAGLTKEALPLLQKASFKVPANPEYAYWEGLCFWANGMPDKERLSYVRGIESAPDTIPLLLNLGHNFLEEKNYEGALDNYNKVISLSSTDPTALYNRALVFHLQKNQKSERRAWKAYLEQYRFGMNSFQAVQHLNNLNDFSYRTYSIGTRKIILNQRALLSMLPQHAFNDNVETLANYLLHDSSLFLDIVFFSEKNAINAKQKAIQLKQHLIAQLGESYRQRIRLSWFGEQEMIQTSNGTKQLSESVLLFARSKDQLNQETTI